MPKKEDTRGFQTDPKTDEAIKEIRVNAVPGNILSASDAMRIGIRAGAFLIDRWLHVDEPESDTIQATKEFVRKLKEEMKG